MIAIIHTYIAIIPFHWLAFKILSWLNQHGCKSFTRLGCFYVTAILSWGYGWVKVDVEAKVDLSLRLKLGWGEIELRLSWVGVEVSLHWIKEEIGLHRSGVMVQNMF